MRLGVFGVFYLDFGLFVAECVALVKLYPCEDVRALTPVGARRGRRQGRCNRTPALLSAPAQSGCGAEDDQPPSLLLW